MMLPNDEAAKRSILKKLWHAVYADIELPFPSLEPFSLPILPCHKRIVSRTLWNASVPPLQYTGTYVDFNWAYHVCSIPCDGVDSIGLMSVRARDSTVWEEVALEHLIRFWVDHMLTWWISVVRSEIRGERETNVPRIPMRDMPDELWGVDVNGACRDEPLYCF